MIRRVALIAAAVATALGGISLADAGSVDPVHHQVVAGETWAGIAGAYGVTAAALQAANPGAGTATPPAGRILHVPSKPPVTTTTTAAPTTTQAATTTTQAATTTTAAATTTTAAATTTTAAATTTTQAATTTTAMPANMHVVCPGEEDDTPLGALPPAKPMLCDHLSAAVDTHTAGPNSWYDDFNHGTTMAELPAAYVQGHVGPGGVSKHFLHNNHWMVDIRSDSGEYPTLLAAWLRPNRTFTTNGSVVVEFEVATPIAGTRDVDNVISDSWPELTISKAAAPTTMNPWGSPFRPNGTYLYEAFPQAWTFGCRMQQSEHPICALYKPDTDGVENYAGGPDRLWEINQNGGDVTYQFGGDPAAAPGLDEAWAECAATDDPDTVCRNTFRVTLSAARILIEVKKPGGSYVRHYEAGLLPGLENVLNGPFYIFFGDFAYRIENNEVIRFHWDHLSVN